MSEPRAKTAEEVRKEFLDYIRELVNYWEKSDGLIARGKLNGLAFSILNIFDGTTTKFPAMNISLVSNDDEVALHKSEGTNWYEDGMVINNCVLHRLYYPEGAVEIQVTHALQQAMLATLRDAREYVQRAHDRAEVLHGGPWISGEYGQRDIIQETAALVARIDILLK